jgi:hypothetical protein
MFRLRFLNSRSCCPEIRGQQAEVCAVHNSIIIEIALEPVHSRAAKVRGEGVEVERVHGVITVGVAKGQDAGLGRYRPGARRAACTEIVCGALSSAIITIITAVTG